MNYNELIRYALRHVGTDYGDQYQFAAEHGIPRSSLSMFLSGQREPTKAILKALGFERMVRYEKITANETHSADEKRNSRTMAHHAP